MSILPIAKQCLYGIFGNMSILKRYFADTPDDNATRMAARLGKPSSTITRIVTGARRLSFKLAMAIEKDTGGKVTAMALLTECHELEAAA